MHPIRMLARLTSKGAWFESPGRATGGKREGVLVPSSEIAGALGMGNLSRPAYLLGLAVFADDNAAINRLVVAMAPMVEYRLASEGFGAERLRELCELAVVEVLWPRRCPDCNGEGEISAAYTDVASRQYLVRWHACPRCAGGGRVSFTQRDAARVLGISHVGFRKGWQVRADIARAVIGELEAKLLDHVRRQMVDEVALHPECQQAG